MIALIPVLMLMDFFGANITDDYVEDNYEYAKTYRAILNTELKKGNGYIPLNRILYFYLEDDKLSFKEIYEDNLDNDTKKMLDLIDNIYIYENESINIVFKYNNEYNELVNFINHNNI